MYNAFCLDLSVYPRYNPLTCIIWRMFYIPGFIDTVDGMHSVRHAEEPLVVGGSDLYLIYRVPSLQEESERYINYSYNAPGQTFSSLRI